MYMGQVKRKKINLWLLILLVLFIIAIIFTIIHINNSTKANSDERYNKSNENKNVVIANREHTGSQIGSVDSLVGFTDITDSTSNTTQTAPSQPTTNPNTFELNNHTYTFSSIDTVSLEKDKYVEMKKGSYVYRMNTDKTSYSDIKSKENLKAYIQDTLHILVTSEMKIGNIKGTDLIICSTADKSEVSYLIITPLNDSEILYLKVYNKADLSNLIEDISGALNDVSALKECIH